MSAQYFYKPRLTARPSVPPLFVPGMIYLFECCEIVGKQKFANEWSGSELLARPMDVIGEDPPMPFRKVRADAQPLRTVGTNSIAVERRVSDVWVFGQRAFASEEAALAARDREKPGALAAAAAERAARQRFETAVYDVRMRLAATLGGE